MTTSERRLGRFFVTHPLASNQSFRVPTDAHSMRAIRKTIESFAADRGFCETKVRDLSLAVAEALFNAMDHGCCQDDLISIDVDFDGARIEVAVEDDGTAETCQDLERSLLDGSELAPEADLERGRGLFLIRAKSDEVRVERAADGGNRVVMVKRR